MYVRLTKAEQAALADLAAANRRRIADEAGLAIAEHLKRNGVTVPNPFQSHLAQRPNGDPVVNAGE